jgi:hypothetical protein
MDRRTFISGVTLGFLTAPLAAEAQQAGKVARIGYLVTGSLEALEPTGSSRAPSPGISRSSNPRSSSWS